MYRKGTEPPAGCRSGLSGVHQGVKLGVVLAVVEPPGGADQPHAMGVAVGSQHQHEALDMARRVLVVLVDIEVAVDDHAAIAVVHDVERPQVEVLTVRDQREGVDVVLGHQVGANDFVERKLVNRPGVGHDGCSAIAGPRLVEEDDMSGNSCRMGDSFISWCVLYLLQVSNCSCLQNLHIMA